MKKKPYSDARWWDNPKPISPQCNDCKHFIDVKNGKPICKAYKDGIPEEIGSNRVIHNKPYPGDAGIIFEPIDK